MNDYKGHQLREQMQQIDKRLDGLERRTENIESMAEKVDAIYEWLIGSLEQPGGLERRVTENERAVGKLESAQSDQDKRLAAVEDTIKVWRGQAYLLRILSGGGGLAALYALYDLFVR